MIIAGLISNDVDPWWFMGICCAIYRMLLTGMSIAQATVVEVSVECGIARIELLVARNFEGRRHPAAEGRVKRGSFKYLKIFFF